MTHQKRKTFYKIVIAGDPAVGKTSIRNVYFGKGFRSTYLVTLGADFGIKRLGEDVLQVWDLAGAVVFNKIRKNYYRGMHGVIFVFDITRNASFKSLRSWWDEMLNHNNYAVPAIFLGNKSDLLTERESDVSEQEINDFLEKLRDEHGFEFPYLSTSAKLGKNIDEAFSNLINEVQTRDIVK